MGLGLLGPGHGVWPAGIATQAESGFGPTCGQQGVATQGACSDAPIPMEMGGAGDGRSWADQVEACPEEEWRRDRLAKHP